MIDDQKPTTTLARAITWRSPYFDSGLFVPQLAAWDPETGEFTRVEGPKGFATWEEAEQAERFLRARQVGRPAKENRVRQGGTRKDTVSHIRGYPFQ